MANLSDLLETIISVFTEVGGYTASHGGKKLAQEAGKKVGWVKEEDKNNNPFATHSLAGHSMGAGYNNRKTKPGEKYDPMKEYKSRGQEFYSSARLSGSGLNDVNQFNNHLQSHDLSSQNVGLSRGAHIQKYKPKAKSKKVQSTPLKNQTTLKGVKF